MEPLLCHYGDMTVAIKFTEGSDDVVIGVSRRNEKDPPNRKIGNMIAIGRAMTSRTHNVIQTKKHGPVKIPVPGRFEGIKRSDISAVVAGKLRVDWSVVEDLVISRGQDSGWFKVDFGECLAHRGGAKCESLSGGSLYEAAISLRDPTLRVQPSIAGVRKHRCSSSIY